MTTFEQIKKVEAVGRLHTFLKDARKVTKGATKFRIKRLARGQAFNMIKDSRERKTISSEDYRTLRQWVRRW